MRWYVEPGFEALADAFGGVVHGSRPSARPSPSAPGDARANPATASARLPAALCVLRDGRVVVEVAAGNDRCGRAFTAATPVLLYSAVKPVTALCVLLAVAGRALDLDATVASVWPAFAAHGKGGVTVREALAHAAAVPGWRQPLTLDDLADRVASAEALAASEPWWTPGEPGEHAVSYGHLLDGILRHGTGSDITAWWTGVNGATGAAITPSARGAGSASPLEDRGGAWGRAWAKAPGPMGMLLTNPPGLLDVEAVNGPAGRELVAPAVTGYGSARALATLWDWWAGPSGARRLGQGLRDASLSPQVTGHDHVLEREVAWGLGPQVDEDFTGMAGIGGCVGGLHPSGLALAFTTPRVGPLARLDPLEEALTSL